MDRMTSATTWTTMLALTLGAGCSSQGAGAPSPAGGAGGAGAGGAPGASSSSSTASSTVSSVVATTGAGGAGGAGAAPFVCDPPAAPGSIYEISAVSYDINAIDPRSMCEYRGDVMLIVDTAAL